jgi:DMSO/TMAO reductase YedYZ heme-binding membrane subunit
MIDFIMRNIGVLLVPFAFFFFFFLGKNIHKYPYHYELGAFGLAILVIIHNALSWRVPGIEAIITSGHLSLSLFILVIFTGVIKKKTLFRKALDLVRGEVAIIAFIFLIPHAFARLDLALSGYNPTGLIANVLFIPLVLTSFMFIRKRMKPIYWKRLHRLSYITYVMIYVHMAFDMNLNPNNFFINADRYAIIYHILLLVYLVLRLINVVIPKLEANKQLQNAA